MGYENTTKGGKKEKKKDRESYRKTTQLSRMGSTGGGGSPCGAKAITAAAADDYLRIDATNMTSENLETRGANPFVSNAFDTKRLIFENKDNQLVEVKRRLTAMNHVICELVGRGTYAEVYRGRNEDAGKDVAIKVIALTEANRHYQETFLQNEIEVIQKLKHRRIIRLYSIFQVDNKIVMVMEYAERGTLGDLISKRGALRELPSWAMFKEAHSGLTYMHDRLSIAHRDLKLENILITRNWVPKLADFSFSVTFDGHTLHTQWCGSLPYFAPELLRNEPYNPLATDIWSMGVCLYIISNDTFPFKTDNDEEMLKAQMERRWVLRPRTEKTYSPRYKDLLRLMLEPKVRYRATAKQVESHRWVATDMTKRD